VHLEVPGRCRAHRRGGVAAAQGRTCTVLSGLLNYPADGSSGDPFGTSRGVVQGDLEGSVTAFLTTFVPSASGNIHVTNNHALGVPLAI
jgi:hypothetical protein